LAALLLLTALALGLRLWNLGARLPAATEPDDVLVEQALHLEGRRLGVIPDNCDINSQYPLLLATILERWPGLLLEPLGKDASLEEHLKRASRPHVAGRTMAVVFSMLLIPGSYLLARRFLGRGASLFAAALVATSLLHLLYAQQARPHVPLATLALAALLCNQRLARTGGLACYLGAGLATGAAVTCLHNGFALLAPLGAALLLRWPREHGIGRLLALLPLALVLLAVDWAYPTLLGNGADFGFDKPDGSFFLSGHRIDAVNLDGRGFILISGYLWAQDPLLLTSL
jgi:Dolichyl-phosphate-mannose-protein mannosyltransferase